MKNKLLDLNNHLFAQMERLNNEDIDKDKLDTEIERSKAMTSVAKEIISNARLALDAQVKVGEAINYKQLPEMLK